MGDSVTWKHDIVKHMLTNETPGAQLCDSSQHGR